MKDNHITVESSKLLVGRAGRCDRAIARVIDQHVTIDRADLPHVCLLTEHQRAA